MKFKNTKKSEAQKEITSSTKDTKEALLKDEIKEIVEETVGEMLKVKSEEGKPPSLDKENQNDVDEKPAIPESSEMVDKSESATVTKDTLPTETPVVIPSVAEAQPQTPAVLSQPEPSEEKKEEAIAPTMPIVNQPEMPSVEPVTMDNDSVEVSKKKSRLPLLLLIFLFLLLLGGGLFYAYSRNMLTLSFLGSSTTQKPAPSKTQHVASTPTPKPVDLTKYKVSVLNGSGVAGEAAKVKSSLTEAGFSVTTTGNADTSDVTDTIISAKATVDEGYLTKLTDTLSKTYKVSSETHKLDSTDSNDVTVTIGSNTK